MNRRDFLRSLLSVPALAFLPFDKLRTQPWQKPEAVTLTGTEVLKRMPQTGSGMTAGSVFDGRVASYSLEAKALTDEEIEKIYQIAKAVYGLPPLKGFLADVAW